MVQAIQIGIKPSMIAGGLSTQPRTTAYNNYVTWSSEAKQPGAKMFLINGNHRVALIQRMYEKEIINLQQARSTCCHGQNKHEKADAGKAVEKLTTKLGQQAVWLVEFYNLDEMEKAPKGSVMLLHLSANTMRPEKVDSDMEKLKNLLHLLRGKSEEEANKVYNTIAQSWVDSKEANSVRPAFIISHRELAKLFARIFAFSTLENLKLLTVSLVYENLNPYLTGLVLALFKPMLSILEFLASPWQIQDIETASTNVLGPRDPTAVLSEQDYQRLLNSMGKVACAALRDPQHAPMIPVLESFDEDCLLASWNDIFSLKLSPFMHLFGTSEPEEIITYQNQYNAYFETVISTTKALVDTILPTISEDDVTRPVLTNLICKLQWVKLGLQPTDEPVIESDMPCPLFTDLSMMTMLGNWNTTKITLCKRDAAGQDINFGPALAEVTDWLFPMCRYPMSAQRGAKQNWTCIMGAVGVFLDNRLNIKDQRKQQACVNQFISLLAGSRHIALTAVRVGVAKLTGGDWEKRHKEHFRSLFKPVGDTKWLDAFTTFMKAYRSQLTGTAPTLARAKASNNIYNAALDGCVSEERKTYFKESLATVSVKKTLHMREPTLDLSNGPLSSKVQELLVNLGYGINLQNLQFMELEEAKEH
ncbi:hypothetical protein PISMIDRAFT_9404 [Pisolithus microcarpus 441]|uniref:Uncharacterized protein n=1 Tax=Pisolithus microcarpus 441 TaxID=765257 RepID=A0A0D0A0L7_9AGAM|nr:hypothetical protein PISMIDRAFT_9404 [Pisolithus microcarpus 441]